MYRIQYGDWIPGAEVRVYSRRFGVWHVGILVWLCGVPMAIHASKDHGVVVRTSLEEFSEGLPVYYGRIPANLKTQDAILRRVHNVLGKPFNVLNANCEDYVNWIITGVARSPQREGMVLAAALFIIFGLGGGFGDDFGAAPVKH
jgi:hypothetical protein